MLLFLVILHITLRPLIYVVGLHLHPPEPDCIFFIACFQKGLGKSSHSLLQSETTGMQASEVADKKVTKG